MNPGSRSSPGFVSRQRRFWPGLPWLLALILRPAACFAQDPASFRLDQCQVIGTHNSYHVAPGPIMDALIRLRSAADADSLAYTHRPLREQLEILGVRQLELDLYADPEGGRFAEPRGPGVARERGLGTVPPHDPEGVLRRPGFKILHVPDVDFVSRNPTFRQALETIGEWSREHPLHFPLFVLIELKDDSLGAGFTPVLPFDERLLEAVDAEIREVLPASQRFEPDQLRRGRPTLREAVDGHGWPAVPELLGRILFALDNEGALRDRYVGQATNLSGKVLFVSVPEDHPAAAWMKINDPVGSFDRIQSLVRRGFLVRSRADAGTLQARTNDGTQRDRALASGAQFVSTDYPEPNRSFSPYAVRLPGGGVARPNPVTGGDLPSGADLEMLSVQTPAHQVFLGERAHAKRRLAEASTHYAKALALDPPGAVTSADLDRVQRFAPELLTHRSEPFRLRDVAAVIHPERPWVGYHLFWEDDLDFPDDNDPCDHEVLWVEYDPATDRPVRVHTYFHGNLLSRPVTDGVVRVAVEWGKHGSLPTDGAGNVEQAPASLRSHWRTLHDSGRRLKDHPLGRGWPVRFEGDYENYLRFDVPLPLKNRFTDTQRVVRSRWPNAVLNQRILPYNFAAKTPWPEGNGVASK
jgi:hypothetical protein